MGDGSETAGTNNTGSENRPSSISRLDAESVRLICSGQVVVDLSTAVKELVENALDAGATSIDVRLKEHGASEIECSDNGIGISPCNFKNIAQRHATSKLQDFDALRCVESFGFRGEALASLCEIANEVVIVTRSKAEKVGTRLTLRHGSATTTSCARSVGTTVTVRGIFAAWPVRRANFQRHLKRQYTKALRVLHAYALIATHCRLSLILYVGQKRSVPVALQGGRSVRDGLASLFGITFSQSLEPINVEIDVHRSAVGVISRLGEGVRRSEGGDRQFLFVNGRPIYAERIVRVFNDAWRSFDLKRKPAFVINLTLPREDVDINMTPDKREVVFSGEANVISCLKTHLQKLCRQSQCYLHTRKSQSLLPCPADHVMDASERQFLPKLKPNERALELSSQSSQLHETRARQARALAHTELKGEICLTLKWNHELESFKPLCNSATFLLQMETHNAHKRSLGSSAIEKTDFTGMEVLGQFNLGFLICKLKQDLFIVDQHAADEKSRYERNWKESKILTQSLLVPLPLELSAADELVLMERIKLFHRNGFRVTIHEAALPGSRVRLHSVPSVKGINFGTKDIAEFISVLTDAGEMCSDEDLPRCPRLHAVFASKACRTAVMVGTPLSVPEMTRLLRELAHLDQPWNCPHGRPTIRHLARLRFRVAGGGALI
mmetsp:Transcript_32741/g.101375  ORF Transcript_32741/g.101375 Transcript_32741/m.101375 type:complete len:669 (-) Transcript_32741:584-2590(-)